MTWQCGLRSMIRPQHKKQPSLQRGTWPHAEMPSTALEVGVKDWQLSLGVRVVYVQGKVSFACKQGDRTNKQEVRCYYCSELGHTMPFCPSGRLSNLLSLMSHAPICHTSLLQEHTTEILTLVLVNGQSAKALVDTGSTQILVHDSF